MSQADLVERCIRVTPDEYCPPTTGHDLLAKGPEEILDIFVPSRHAKGARPAELVDLEDVVRTFVIGIGDTQHKSKFPKSPCLEPEQAMAGSFEFAKLSESGVRDFFAASIKSNPNSVWIEKHSDPNKHLLTHLIPIEDGNCQKFLTGEVDDVWLAHAQPQEKTTNFLITAIFGDLRRRDFHTSLRLMYMVFTQLGRMSSPIREHGLRLFSFNCSELIVERLMNWGFELTGGQTARTGFPIMELQVASSLWKNNRKSAALWSLVFFYQHYVSNNQSMLQTFKSMLVGQNRKAA